MSKLSQVAFLLLTSLFCIDCARSSTGSEPTTSEATSSAPTPAEASPESGELEVEWIPGPPASGNHLFLLSNHGSAEVSSGNLALFAANTVTGETRQLSSISLPKLQVSATETVPLHLTIGKLLSKDEIPFAQPIDSARLPVLPLAVPRTQNKKLVQVLLYGLMVFKDRTGSIVAHLPGDHNHTTTIAIGKVSGSTYMWEAIKPNGISTEIKNKFIRFNFGGGTLSRDRSPLNRSTPPTDTTTAKHPSWLLTEKEIENGTDLTGTFNQASNHVLLTDGVFETCGLVYYPSISEVCTVQVASNVDRTMAELMVLRKEDPSTIEIQLCDTTNSSGQPEPTNCQTLNISIPSTGRCSVDHSDCYDIAVRNVETSTTRGNQTTHTIILAKLFQSPTPSRWLSAHTNSCSATFSQPVCFERYSQFGGDFSAYNRPICPFVEDI